MTLGHERAGKLTPGSEVTLWLAAPLTGCSTLPVVRHFLGHGGGKNES